MIEILSCVVVRGNLIMKVQELFLGTLIAYWDVLILSTKMKKFDYFKLEIPGVWQMMVNGMDLGQIMIKNGMICLKKF